MLTFDETAAHLELRVQSVMDERNRMRQFAMIAMVVLGLGCTGWTQTSPKPAPPSQIVKKSPLAGYAGTWTGTFEQRPWLTVQLTLAGEKLSGSLLRANDLKFNDAGDLKSVGDTQVTEVVQDATPNGDGLLLTVKNPDTNETDRFTMRLTGETTAELKMSAMSMPPGDAQAGDRGS